MGKKLVVVESPTKARTIRKFLGDDYIVESCMGHIRDLPQSAKDIPEAVKKEPWAKLGVNTEKNFEPLYCVPKDKTKIVRELKKLLKEADELILATDEDREGESISFHLVEVLKPKVPVKRMVFHEITKKAIMESLGQFRHIDTDLVRAQEARRILDRLVGYTISPLLWKKVAYGLSAGRVQSVAVRLVAEREHERLRFVKTPYCGVTGKLEKSKVKFDARLFTYDGKRIASGKDFDSETGQLKADKVKTSLHLNPQEATRVVKEIEGLPWQVSSVEEKPTTRKPYAPFITSTLQQEANRKLGMSSRETMQAAQKLYERGFITYMRTDSTFLSTQAIEAARTCIENRYGKEYLPEKPRDYAKKKVKGAQEAHEAIRPAGTEFPLPENTGLRSGLLSLYELIWKRTVASQMVDSKHKQMSVKFKVGEDSVFSASGMTIEFPGFLKAYVEGADDPDTALDNREVRLPKLKVGDTVDSHGVLVTEHETKPPARYTEASLVQKMEKEGIGRPSTYASIITTIQSRGYARKIGSALVPTFTALVVSRLLKKYLPDYVDLKFTSGMEDSLDEIAQGELDSIQYLERLYNGDEGLRALVDQKEAEIDPETSRAVELEGLSGLTFKVGRYGAYVCRFDETEKQEFCASLPESKTPGDVTSELAHKLIDQKINGADSLGKHPETGLPIYILTGRYGPYVQMGDTDGSEEQNKAVKRGSIPPTMDYENLTFEQAVFLLSLPKTLGDHPETEKVVKLGIGRFGPYVVHDGDFRSIPKEITDVSSVTFEKAMELLSQPKKGRRGSKAIKELGVHPETEEKVDVFTGKYGPYIKCGKVNVSLPDEVEPEKVTLEQAVELLEPRMKKGGKKKKAKKKAKKKKAAKKKAAKKKTTKKKAKKKSETKTKASTKKKVIRRKAAQS